MRHQLTRIARVLTGALLVSLLCVALPSPAGAADNWVRRAAPSPSASSNTLLSVSCVSDTVCHAVGYYETANGAKTLIAHTTDGVNWIRATSPNPGPQLSELHDVSCTTATDCTAVGTYATGVVNGEYHLANLVLRTTNGTSWQVVPSPNPNGFPAALWGVSCTSPTRCRAVGDSGGNSLVLRTSNGATWFRQPSPNRGSGANFLISIDCTTNASCLAVGFYYATPTANAKTKTLALRTTDGPTWSVVNTPNPSPSTSDNYLNYVSCVGPTTCTAVGAVDPIPGPTKRAFILRTTSRGDTWTRAATPAAGGVVDIRGVSCQSTTECTAVGIEWNAAHTTFKGSILRTTNGTGWTASNPSADILGRDIWGVSCAVVTKCHAVGGFNTSGDPAGSFKSLVLRET